MPTTTKWRKYWIIQTPRCWLSKFIFSVQFEGVPLPSLFSIELFLRNGKVGWPRNGWLNISTERPVAVSLVSHTHKVNQAVRTLCRWSEGAPVHCHHILLCIQNYLRRRKSDAKNQESFCSKAIQVIVIFYRRGFNFWQSSLDPPPPLGLTPVSK